MWREPVINGKWVRPYATVNWVRIAPVGIAAIAHVIFATAVWAQATGSASIAGVITDPSSAVLPGVTVEAASPALIEKVRGAVTDARGQYRIVDLRPGVYTVTFTLPGFRTVRREGIELTPNLTANVIAELAVGDVQETVTVSGASPIVDVQSVTQTRTMSRELLDAVPTSKGMLSFAALTPAVVSAPTGQDVGGSRGEVSVRMAIHGSRGSDQKLLLDGMRYNTTLGAGTGRTFLFNPASAEEITIELPTGGSAEYDTGGAHINLVPKDGGNRFNAYFFTTYTNDKLQGTNLDQGLKDRGLTLINEVRDIYDVNGSVGGPILVDKLWFHATGRKWGNSFRVANLYHNATQGTFVYTPDLSKPAYGRESFDSLNGRLTWQATPKNKVTMLTDVQSICFCTFQIVASNAALEAVNAQQYPSNVFQATWTRPHTDRLLFSAGVTLHDIYWRQRQQPGAESDISILEQSNGFRYGSAASYTEGIIGQWNQRFTMAYITGSHNFKTGVFLLESVPGSRNGLFNNQSVNYTFLNGRPISLTEYAFPLHLPLNVRELALYAQDQWTVQRLTLSAGLRFEYLSSAALPSTQQANRFFPARSFPGLDCLPCWKDLTPRLGVAYDVFGTGTTAVKGSIGRYTASEMSATSVRFHPANAAVSNVTRTWTDSNGNFVPDCNLTDPAAQDRSSQGGDVCGRMSDALFGQTKVTTRPDPDTLSGWQHRAYNWQASASIEQQLMSGVAVSVGYYRTWYGNFTVTDNLAVTPADFDPYCITAPADSRLPGGGGDRICGLYDLNPAKVGQVDNLVTFASKYGKQTEVYNGVDVNLSARLPRGGQLSGGVNIGNSINVGQAGGVSHTNNCDVISKLDSPNVRYCDVAPPYRPQLKLLGSYPLPWDLQVSGTFQTQPGAPIDANYVATNAQIVPTLGRSLSQLSTASIPIIEPFTQFERRINQFDARLTKIVRLGKTRVLAIFDAYNLFNANPVLAMNSTYSGSGATWLRPQQILDARLFKFGAQFDF